MPLNGKVFLPFRLKLLVVLLAAAGAGIYSSYGGFSAALRPFSEDEAGTRLLSRLELAAAVMDEDVKNGLTLARLTAARTGLREVLARHNTAHGLPSDTADLARRLADAAAASSNIAGLDLAGTDGRIAASLEKKRLGLALSSTADLRLGQIKAYISAPRVESDGIFYDVSVPVPALTAAAGRPLGVLRCRFIVAPAQKAAMRTLRTGGLALVLAKKGSRQLIIGEGPGPAREINLKSPEGALFLPALSREEGVSAEEGISGRMLYGWKNIPSAGWLIAARTPFPSGTGNSEKLLGRARLSALLAFVLLAVAAFFTAGLLAAPLGEAGRQAALLLEQCGKPAADKKLLCEPGALAGAIEEAAGILKKQSSRDLELETETEKLREEEADLQSQNVELEKLNKYLMERETKISELKKEIADLREKVGGGA